MYKRFSVYLLGKPSTTERTRMEKEANISHPCNALGRCSTTHIIARATLGKSVHMNPWRRDPESRSQLTRGAAPWSRGGRAHLVIYPMDP